MNVELRPPLQSWLPSAVGRERMKMLRGEPMLYADWLDVVFLHYAVDPEVLQPLVPWELDLRDGMAYVSLVAFTMRDMRPRRGGKLAAWLFKPIATHEFLNVRTYVKHEGEAGIYFLAEWLPNALSVAMGPAVFGLPYRHGRLAYQNEPHDGHVGGMIEDAHSGAAFEYRGSLIGGAAHSPCEAGSLEEFVVERYTAFTSECGLARCFRIWHPPWPVAPVEVEIEDRGLLAATGEWSRDATFIGAHHSDGFPDVWMSRPSFVTPPQRHGATVPSRVPSCEPTSHRRVI